MVRVPLKMVARTSVLKRFRDCLKETHSSKETASLRHSNDRFFDNSYGMKDFQFLLIRVIFLAQSSIINHHHNFLNNFRCNANLTTDGTVLGFLFT